MKKKKKSRSDICSDIWPNERDLIESPHRLKYIRKIVKPKDCVFCQASKNWKDPKSLVLFKSQHLMIILNKYPYNNGHLLILPRSHVADYEKLNDKILWGLFVLVRHSIKILKKIYRPQGFNMGMNLGQVAGAGIPNHLHFHLIPRWEGDTNFFPLIAETKLVVETSQQSYTKLKPHFDKLEKQSVL